MRKLAPGVFVTVLSLVLAGLAAPAGAQPFGAWLILSGPTNGYIEFAHNAAFNPTSAITIEGWVNVTDPGGCSSIIGKNWQQAWWVGICGTTLRSYLKGASSQRNGGTLSGWTHFAVVYNGANRYHYINGELVGTFAETGPLPGTTDVLRIGSDISYNHTPHGTLNEIRLWNVARTTDQIRATINVPITTAQPGLVAVWHDGMHDSLGVYNGTAHGSTGFLTFPVTTLGCGTETPTSYCFANRFNVVARFRVGAPGTAEGQAQTLPCSICQSSGIFWFFASTNWEVMVKEINGCGLNNRYWVFSAATTNVFYRLEVFDTRAGVNKVYFNYPGPPAPAVTDTSAFATCP